MSPDGRDYEMRLNSNDSQKNTMKNILKITNHITAYITLFSLVFFLFLFILVTLNIRLSLRSYSFFSYLAGWSWGISCVFSTPVAVILFCIRRFIYKVEISSIFIILIFIEILFISLTFFNVGNIMYYLFD